MSVTDKKAAEKEKARSLGEMTGAVALAVGLISAWLYVAGWTYAYHYFDKFGIPLLMVEIPREHYFVYGGVVLEQFPIWELLIAAVVIAAAFLWRRFRFRLDAGPLTMPLGLIALLALFWLGHEAAVAAANRQFIQQRDTDYSAYRRVQVWPKDAGKVSDKTSEGSPRTSPDLTKGCYRLVLHNQNRLFLVRPREGAATEELSLLILPWDQVEAMRVLPDYTSCM
jgi:hypothetical protein